MTRLLTLLLIMVALPVSAQSLKGSKTAVKTAYQQALEHDFTFLNSEAEQTRFIAAGWLVALPGNQHYRLHKVKRPYVRPEVKTFVERLAQQYYSGCGEQLVVTDALRFVSERPRNGSRESVHPTGMAVDIRSSVGLIGQSCHDWLRRNLLLTEDRDITEVTLERNPPHFHVVIFPRQYACYVVKRTGGTCHSARRSAADAKTTGPITTLRPLRRPDYPLTSARPRSR